MSRKLIVGLGNPGRQYARTRHNIGFLVADGLADKLGGSFSTKKASAELAEAVWKNDEVVIAKPQTFMNLSGKAVKELVGLYDAAWTKDLMVVVDDADLDFGKFRIRERGSSGGHRGLDSIIERLGTQNFNRFRIGVGRPEGERSPLAGHVLEPFTADENAALAGLVENAVRALTVWIEKGPQVVMNQYNR